MDNGTAFQDHSTECAICLSDLNEGANIKLSCGHKWHLQCLKDQLEHAQPDCARRLLFNGCRCAKCGHFCNHPSLEQLTRKTDALRERVDALIEEQLHVDMASAWRRAQSDPDERKRLMDRGRRIYAFYLCGSCKEPYFGGSIECADQNEGERPAEDRLCSSCTSQSQQVCRHPALHRGFHVWKCRYCCKPSRYVCYGTVHFCEDCHSRNSQRERQQHRRAGNGPPPLNPIPCPGGESCSHPKLPNQQTHNNGPSSKCEQVYHCAWCLSDPSSPELMESQGSHNLVINSSGAEGLHGWEPMPSNRGPRIPMWNIETSDLPVNADTRTNFVSTHRWCIMFQRIPIHNLLRDSSSARFEVSCRYMGRTDCPSVFALEAQVIDVHNRPLHRCKTPILEAPPDFWERASLEIPSTVGAHQLVLVVYGKDSRFWNGNFGSKISDCSVRVLGTQAQVERMLLPAAVARGRGDARTNVMDFVGDMLRRHQTAIGVLVVLFLAWLSSSEEY